MSRIIDIWAFIGMFTVKVAIPPADMSCVCIGSTLDNIYGKYKGHDSSHFGEAMYITF